MLFEDMAYHLKAANVFTLRAEMYLWVYNANFLALTKTIADIFHKYFEPEKAAQLPPEMMTRPIGHDFGFGDYIN